MFSKSKPQKTSQVQAAQQVGSAFGSIFAGLDNAKDPTQRDFCSICVFGDLGTGKSTFLSQFAKQYVEKNASKKVPRRVLIADPSKAKGFDVYPTITLSEIMYGFHDIKTGKVRRWTNGIMVLRDVAWNKPDWFKVLTDHFQNGLVILDESRNYIPTDKSMSSAQKEFFTIHRNACVDVMVVSHDFMSLHLDLRKAFRVYVVFRTGDKPNNEAWFTTRSLPEDLYKAWRVVSRFRSPSAKMSPFVVFDKTLLRWRLYADTDRLEVIVPDPDNPGKSKIVPYHQLKK